VIPFIDTAPRAARPVIVWGLIAVNTLIFLWMRGLPPATLEATLVHYALIPVRFTDPDLAISVGLDPTNWWPIVTDMFMHGGWMHLIFNMWFLWIFGPAMEGRFGRLGFCGLYLVGGVVANVVHIVTHVESTEPVLGASGAIAAVIAAYAVTYPWARVLTIVPLGFIPLFIPVPAIVFAVIWFGLQVLQGSSELASPGMAASVAWWAHIGGFAFGALFAILARPALAAPARPTTEWTHTHGWRVPDVRQRRWPPD
jgi:membrane associated rhomboid family serine protease